MYECMMWVPCSKCGQKQQVSRDVYAYSPDRRCVCASCIEKMTPEEREKFDRQGERYNKG